MNDEGFKELNARVSACVFTEGSYVIIGEHLDLESARRVWAHQYDEAEATTITSVRPAWVRYEFMSEMDLFDEGIESEASHPGWWVLFEQIKRPRGVVRKATVVGTG